MMSQTVVVVLVVELVQREAKVRTLRWKEDMDIAEEEGNK